MVLPGAQNGHSRLGITLALLAACCYALQAHSIHTLTRRHTPTTTVAVLFTGAAAVLSPLLPRGIGLVSGNASALTGACGCRKPYPGHAASVYSWMTPPMRLCRRTRKALRSLTGAGIALRGAACLRDRCGRCSL